MKAEPENAKGENAEDGETGANRAKQGNSLRAGAIEAELAG